MEPVQPDPFSHYGTGALPLPFDPRVDVRRFDADAAP